MYVTSCVRHVLSRAFHVIKVVWFAAIQIGY